MNRLFIAALALAIVSPGAMAKKQKQQDKKEGYVFVIDKQVPATSVKDQAASGTCWSFGGTAFLESELLRKGKGEFDLSEMWVSRNSYFDKAVKYARMHGNNNLSGGGALGDIFNVIERYGMVPEEVYTGLNYGTKEHRHGEIDATIKAYMDAVIANPNRQLSTAWQAGLNGILDAYYGPRPEKFTYKGVEYTPRTFADMLGIRSEDYTSITSFTNYPMGKMVVLEIPDNWDWNQSLNMPLEQMNSLMLKALDNGMSVYWSADVSEKGFSANKGIAVLPAIEVKYMGDSEKAKWSELTAQEKDAASKKFLEGPVKEVEVTEQSRQAEFDNYQTTDDHCMQITGLAHDQNGTKYYLVKNSWGESVGPYKGYLYASENFVKAKTTCIIIATELLK